MQSWSVCWEARRCRASRGPKASRSWKPGKRRRAILVGRGLVEGVEVDMFELMESGFVKAGGVLRRVVMQNSRLFMLKW